MLDVDVLMLDNVMLQRSCFSSVVVQFSHLPRSLNPIKHLLFHFPLCGFLFYFLPFPLEY